MKNFWNELKKPVLVLAPMADVTDAAFRHIIAKYSKTINDKDAPCRQDFVMFTEFVSADGLALAPEEGRKKLLKDLEYSEIERPIVAQFFTSKPENMEKAAMLAVELGFDGVDINMGCPDRSIEKQGAGAALIKNPLLARQLIRAAKEGASRGALAKWGSISIEKVIPISVKTRLGYNKDELEGPVRIDGSLGGWLPELLKERPAAITIHARTRKEMSKVPARWARVARAVEIRDSLKSKTLILGNGDLRDVEDAIQKCKESDADGAMLGRAIFGNPFLFKQKRPDQSEGQIIKEKLKIMAEHTKLFEEKFEGFKNFAIMKKHYKAYLSGVARGEGNAKSDINWQNKVKNLKQKLMEAKNADEVIHIVDLFIKNLN